jgi:fatty acid desaturase
MYTLSMIALPLCMAIYTEPSIWWALLFPVHVYLIANLQNTSLHHQSHWPMFENAKWNEYYQIIVSMPSGLTHQGWKYAHTLHHKYVNDKPSEPGGETKDPVSVFKHSLDGSPTNFWKYTFGKAWSDLVSVFMMFPYPKPEMKKYAMQLKYEQIAIKVFFIVLALINPVYTIQLIVVYYFGFVANCAISYGEHWTVLDRRGDTTQDSIGSYDKWVNIIGFGAGLHQEHHHKPGVHWTQYAEVTKLLNPNRKIVHGLHISNNPFWDHFKLLFKK